MSEENIKPNSSDSTLDHSSSSSALKNNENAFDLASYHQNIPKEMKKVFQIPPSIGPTSFQNYGVPIPQIAPSYHHHPPSVPHYYPTVAYNQTNSNYLNNNSVWNVNAYQRRNGNFPFERHSMPTIISKLAEDKMRPTFKSIEMILETFNSINYILESTYSTIYGSFRTITNVADQLIFIRNHFLELALFPRLAHVLIDFLRWLFKFLGLNQSKLFKMFGSHSDDVLNEAWSNSSPDQIHHFLKDNNQNSSLWPVLIFFSLVLGTPYIVWRLLGENEGCLPRTNLPEWTSKNGRHFLAIGLHDFKARTSNELSFKKGEMLFVNPESLRPDIKWLLACNNTSNDNQTPNIGFIPLNFVKLLFNK